MTASGIVNRAGPFDVIEVGCGHPYPVLGHAPDIVPVSCEDLRTDAPDTHLILRDRTGTLAARASCWWTSTPRADGRRVGAIGHFAAAGGEAGQALLAAACSRLRGAGCGLAVGPMDGSTWRSYRLVTMPGSEPPFFLEPCSSTQATVAQWEGAGFSVIADYVSAVTRDLDLVDPRVRRAERRLTERGIAVRPLGDPETDLRRIFGVCCESFRRNFMYSPIAEAEFFAQYRRVLPFVRPELVLLAERQHGAGVSTCGFAFALPDMAQAQRGEPIDTVIVKSLAVLQSCGAAGLGSVLVSHVHAAARRLGFRRAIHALMHARNASVNISRRYAVPMRRYALFGKRLTP